MLSTFNPGPGKGHEVYEDNGAHTHLTRCGLFDNGELLWRIGRPPGGRIETAGRGGPPGVPAPRQFNPGRRAAAPPISSGLRSAETAKNHAINPAAIINAAPTR